MNSVSPLHTTNNSHENWVPLLDFAAREVSEIMLGCKLTIPETAVEEASLTVTSMVGLAGLLCGVLSVRCSEKAAELITSKMLGVDLDKVGPEVADALGEVCNMVAGNFKNKIAGLSEGCMLSPPTVITGSDYNLQSMSGSPSIELRLLFDGLPLIITLQIQS
jgi:chemotaxis protein CheX